MRKPGIKLISPKPQLNSQTPNNTPHVQLCRNLTEQELWCDLHCRVAPDVTSYLWGTAHSELNNLPAFLPHQFPLPGSHTDFKWFKIWDLPKPLLKAECVTVWIQFPCIVCVFYRKMSLHCPDLSSAQGSSSRTASVTRDRYFIQDLPAGSWTNEHSFTLWDQAHVVQSGKGLLWMVMAHTGPEKKKSHLKQGPSRKSFRFQSAYISFLETIYYFISVPPISSDWPDWTDVWNCNAWTT